MIIVIIAIVSLKRGVGVPGPSTGPSIVIILVIITIIAIITIITITAIIIIINCIYLITSITIITIIPNDNLYEEFTRLAETRLAQNKANYLEIRLAYLR